MIDRAKLESMRGVEIPEGIPEMLDTIGKLLTVAEAAQKLNRQHDFEVTQRRDSQSMKDQGIKIVSDHCECEICLSVRKAGMGGGE